MNGGFASRCAGALPMALVLCALAAACYYPSIYNGFALDDVVHIVENPLLRDAGAAILTAPAYPGNLYRPALYGSYAITYRYFGLDPFPYHVTNVALHAVNVLLAWILLRKFIAKRSAVFAALLFAASPLLSEAVANVSGRAELLCTFGSLLSILFFLKVSARESGPLTQWWAFAALGAAWSLALFSKESAVVVLGIEVWCLIFWIGRGGSPRQLAAIAALLLQGAIFAWYAALRINTLGGFFGSFTPDAVDNALFRLGSLARAANGLSLLGREMAALVMPPYLSADYSFACIIPPASINAALLDSNFILGLIVVAASLVALVSLTARGEPRAFGLGWFFLAFAVTSNVFFPIGTIFAERLAYLPAIGFYAWFADLLLGFRPWIVARAAAFLFAGVYAFVTVTHVRVWRSDEALYRHQIEVSACSAKTQANYAIVAEQDGRPKDAHAHLIRALEIAPDYDVAAFGLGALFYRGGVLSRAEFWLKKTLEINSSHAAAKRMLEDVERKLLPPEPAPLEPAADEALPG